MKIPILSDAFGNLWDWATHQPWYVYPIAIFIVIALCVFVVAIVFVIVAAIVAAIGTVIVAIILAPFGA